MVEILIDTTTDRFKGKRHAMLSQNFASLQITFISFYFV
jgi:hypothetical protein